MIRPNDGLRAMLRVMGYSELRFKSELERMLVGRADQCGGKLGKQEPPTNHMP